MIYRLVLQIVGSELENKTMYRNYCRRERRFHRLGALEKVASPYHHAPYVPNIHLPEPRVCKISVLEGSSTLYRVKNPTDDLG